MTAEMLVYHLTLEALRSPDRDERLTILSALIYDTASSIFDSMSPETSDDAAELRSLAAWVDGIYTVGRES